MKEVYVIVSEWVTDIVDYDREVIGVASSKEQYERIINEYFGKHNVERFDDIRDSGIENGRTIMTKSGDKYIVTVMSFQIDKI